MEQRRPDYKHEGAYDLITSFEPNKAYIKDMIDTTSSQLVKQVLNSKLKELTCMMQGHLISTSEAMYEALNKMIFAEGKRRRLKEPLYDRFVSMSDEIETYINEFSDDVDGIATLGAVKSAIDRVKIYDPDVADHVTPTYKQFCKSESLREQLKKELNAIFGEPITEEEPETNEEVDKKVNSDIHPEVKEFIKDNPDFISYDREKAKEEILEQYRKAGAIVNPEPTEHTAEPSPAPVQPKVKAPDWG